MSLVIQTAPTAEPIAVADLKRFWGVDFGEDDDRIAICGKAARFPLRPAASRNEPADAAMPMHTVFTSGRMYCMVS